MLSGQILLYILQHVMLANSNLVRAAQTCPVMYCDLILMMLALSHYIGPLVIVCNCAFFQLFVIDPRVCSYADTNCFLSQLKFLALAIMLVMQFCIMLFIYIGTSS